MRPKKYRPARVAKSLIASAFIFAALVLPTVNRAAGQILIGINLSPADPILEVSQSQQFTATAIFDDGSSLPASGQTGAWVSTGSMAASRYYHTATRLQDGAVLVAGGYNSSNSLASAERFDPATGLWSPAGSMSVARAAHTATLLPNGRVLVAGGINFPGNAVTNTTEIYDPASNTWSAGPPLPIGVRAFHSAVALNSGEVMVVAGVRGYPDCTYRNTAEIYNPVTNSWHATGSLGLARTAASTALLNDGRVLLAGGPANNCPTPNNAVNEAEIYDPATGLWSVLPNLSINRSHNFIATMPDGRVLLAGGRTVGASVTATTDVFNPATSSFSPTAPLSIARGTSGGTGDNGATVVLQDGRVLVAGGHNDVTVFSTVELFDPSTSTWSATGSLLTARTHNTITSLGNGHVLVVGGAVGAAPLASAEVYRPQIIWTSSNPAVATIDQNGLATAVALGTTTISAASGSISGSTTLTVATDTLPPATTASYAPPNANGWHSTDVIVQLNATDSGGPVSASGVQSITYSLSGAQSGGGTANGSSLSFTVSNEGTTTVTYHATDHNGNVEPNSTVTIRIDRTRPTLSGLPNLTADATSNAGAVVLFTPIALDAVSGVDSVTVTQGLASGSTFPHGTTNVEVTVVDNAGNSRSQGFGVTVIKTLTSIAVAPPTATINASVNTQQFFATGGYTDGSSQQLGNGAGWVPAGSLATPRSYHTATRLQDGSVLIVGGYNHVTTSFASAERYYPSTHTWASAGSMAVSRLGHSATLLPNGKVIVVGGRQHPSNALTNTTEIYDPLTNAWSAGPSLTLGVREAHSAVLLDNGRVLIAAGLQSYPDCTYRASAELYDPVANTWSPTGSLHLARSAATMVLLANGRVLLAAGPQNGCPTPNVGLNQAEVYDPATGVWTVTGNLSVPRYGNSITVLPSGKVLLAGGVSTPGFVVVASADIYDPVSGAFSPTGSMATPRMTAVGTGDNGVMPRLADGRVLFAGGHNPWTNTIFSSSELFDPITGTWSSTASLNTARTNHTVTLLDDGTVLAVGGIGPGGVPIGGAEIYAPPAVSWSSSSPGVASINQSGVAAGAADGTSTITASAGAINGTAALTVDRTAPTTTATPSSPNLSGWNNTDVQVMLNATDGANGTGVQSISYSYNGPQSGGPFNAPGNSTSVLIGSEGTTTLNYQAVDVAGNTEGNRGLSIRIDRTAPFLSYPNQIQTTASSSAGAVVNFFVSGFDNLSGLAGSVSVSPRQSGETFPIGTTTQTVTATDNAGNTATATFDVIVTPGDTMPPTTTENHQGPNANGWNRFNVFVSLNAFDQSNDGSPSGVNSITYSLSGAQTGGGTVMTSFTSFTITNEGTTTVTYHATDNRGNVEADRSFTVRLDKTQPTAANLGNIQANATSTAGAIVNFNLSPADAVSGVDTVVFTQGLPSGSLFPHGTTNESVTITDRAGNTASRSFSVTVNKTLLSIAVQPSNATVNVGDDRFFSAMGHFTSGPDQLLSTGGGGSGSGGSGGGGSGTPSSVGFWNIHFTPGLDVSACGGIGGASYSSQAFSVNATGLINNTQWSPLTPRVNVTGQVTANVQATLTISCIDNANISTTVTLPWQTTSFDGSITFSGQTTNAHVTGWSSQPSMPTPAFASGAATVGNNLYVVGGGVNGAPSGLVQVFDLTSRTWLAPAAPMSPREGPGVAALNGYIYAAGGHMPGGDATNTLQRFDPVANQWVTLAPMLGPRAELQLVAANGMLYAIGGQTGNGTQPPVATVERYDPVANEWVARASMSSARMFFAAGALNDGATIIVAGGSGSSVELYNIGTNTWSATSSLQVSMAAGATIANRFYVATQCGSFVYRPADGQLNEGWAIMPNMRSPRSEFAVAVSGDVMYAAGGFTGSDPSSSVATFDALSTPPPGDLAYNQSGASCPGSGGGGGGSSLPAVQWSSSDSSIAGINSSGSATGNAPGQATIIATAAGVSCATTNSCGTLTVIQPTYLTFTLAPGSQPFDFVTVTIVDRVTGEIFDTFNVPIGEPQSVSAEEGDQVRLLISAPAGYQVSPTEVEPNLHNGDLTIALLFTDAEPPTITAPAGVTAEATSADGAVVDPGQAIGSDPVGPVTISRSPVGNQFALGTTTITWRATDGAGNFSEATQLVTVVDTTSPAITAPGDITAEATSASGASVDPGQAIASDLAGPVTITRSPAGNQFALGTTTITWRVTDGAGHVSEATQHVTIADTTLPVLNLPGNITVDATSPQGALVTYAASATDGVSGSLAVTCSTASGSTFAIGTTTVTCTATDAAGNSAIGSFTVLVQAAAAQVSQLSVAVQSFNLQQGISNSLDAKLTNVLNALNGATSGNTAAVCSQLSAFINETNAQSGKKLTVAQADQLIAAAHQIQAVIGCQ